MSIAAASDLRERGEHMTVFQYLQSLPQDLFEATLASLMGFELASPQEDTLHKWLNMPYEKYFTSDNAALPETPMSLIGREAAKLPKEQQEKLRNAMREYCEVCDTINQNLVSEQKKA